MLLKLQLFGGVFQHNSIITTEKSKYAILSVSEFNTYHN